MNVTRLLERHPDLRLRNARLAAIPKPDGSIRLLLDLSDFDPRSGLQRGVNGACGDPGWTPMASPLDAQAALSAIRRQQPGARILMQVTDLKEAYRSVPLTAADWPLTRIAWAGQQFWDVRLSQGARWSAAAQCQIATLIARAAAHRDDPIQTVLAYVDDFLSIDTDPATPTTTALQNILERAGYTLSAKKLLETGPPSQRKRWIGYTWDTEAWTVGIPPDKVAEALLLLKTDPRMKTGTMQTDTAMRLAGKLTHFARVLTHAQPFTVNLAREAQRAFSRRSPQFVPSQGTLDDLHWWSLLLHTQERWDVPIHDPTEQPTESIACDASTLGFGFTHQDQGFFGTWWTPQTADRITALELLTVLIALQRLGSQLQNKTVRVLTDNQAVSHILTTGRTRGTSTLPILRQTALLLLRLRIRLVPEWIPGVTNEAPDALSRQQWTSPALRHLTLSRVCAPSTTPWPVPSYSFGTGADPAQTSPDGTGGSASGSNTAAPNSSPPEKTSSTGASAGSTTSPSANVRSEEPRSGATSTTGRASMH